MPRRSSVRSDRSQQQRPDWLADQNIVVFGGERDLPVGAIEQHSLADVFGGLFGRSREDVRSDWEKIVNQIQYLLEGVAAITRDYEMEEITFQLGFSAEGQLVFVAKAGITTTIQATFRRKAAAQ